MRRGRCLVSLTDRLDRLGKLREALDLAGTSAQVTAETAASIGLDVDRATLVKIDRGLRTLRQGG